MFYAHSGNNEDRSDWQPLSEHLLAVAQLAEELARPLGLERVAMAAGLLHDLGKYTEAFQRRLEGGSPVDHSTAGASFLIERAKRADRGMAELAAYAILGHHAGLPDRKGSGHADMNSRLEDFTGQLDPAWENELGEIPQGLLPSGFRFSRESQAFDLSVMGRMIFSCLVDADFKETEAFYARLEGRARDRKWPALADLLDDWRGRFDEHMAGMGGSMGSEGDLNALRRRILDHVRGKAAMPPGLFTLTVPTGGGKTLTSLGFALDHAAKHGHRRIIYAIPFTSIIDQTVAVFQRVLGAQHILEHHSAIEETKPDGRGAASRHEKMRLAMEDWAAPLVVTTNVQLFESLFASRTSRARKLHNIARSVIILDEAQTLPRRLLLPTLRMMDALCRHWGCTIVLCTATQPALDKRNLKSGLELEGRELAPEPALLAQKLQRAKLRKAGPMSDDDLIDALRAEPTALVIVNSRRHALTLYRAAMDAGLEGVVHLTTRQYAAHRKEILARIRAKLNSDEPCRVIATSLVEAGVDLDFPKVWRASAGLDQVVQAAGRCNREGKRPLEESIVTVFEAPDHPAVSEVAALARDWERSSQKQEDPLSLEAIEDYFREVYWREDANLDREGILENLSVSHITGTDFAYRSIAERYRMIESGLEPVIVADEPWAKQWVEKLAVPDVPSGLIARELQTAIVQVPPKARQLLIENGHVAFAEPALRGDQFAVLRTDSLYKHEIGLLWENAEYIQFDDTII